MIILIPLVSWGIAQAFVEANNSNRWLEIPRGLALPGVSSDLIVTVLVTFVIVVLLFGAYSIAYMLMYRMVGPSTYGPQDAPPIRYKHKRKTSR
jgi:hypothetical protein